MAELNVQPKKGFPSWLWLLLGIILLAILFFLFRTCNDPKESIVTNADTTSTANNEVTANPLTWDNIDFNSPSAAYDEITDKNINVRGGNGYAIYSLGEDILFDSDKSTIRPQAEANLKQIASSLTRRYTNGNIRVYGYTDAEGSAGYNKQLAEQRAEAVKGWLMKNNNITEDRISVHPVGESRPAASNNTESGRKQNRRVEIVARGNESK
ncbi:MAG: OmpA family protein [Chitinophagaceae bacterium]